MRLFFILLAFVLAVASGLAFYSLSNKPEEQATPVVQVAPEPVAVPETYVLVARQDIPVGKKINEQDIDRQLWPQNMVHPEFITQGNEVALIGRVSRTPFKKGEPLATSRLANPNDPGFLAAQLGEGMRAITIPVDAISGVNGFVYPGDRVDIIIHHNVGLEDDFEDGTTMTEEGTPVPATTVVRMPIESSMKVPLLMSTGKRSSRPEISVTEVLLANVKVLAVGQQSYQYENASNVPTNVTLEVNEVQASKLRHAEAGSISLALRSLKDAESSAYPRPVADADMSRLIPPSYFPYQYGDGEYETEVIDLEAADYSAPEKQKENQRNGSVTIIRGTEKASVAAAVNARLEELTGGGAAAPAAAGSAAAAPAAPAFGN